MIHMDTDKFFYKYQSFEETNGNKYVIENLSNNQLYFQHPSKYNDPFDSSILYYSESTVEAYINKLMKVSRYTREQAFEILSKLIQDGKIKQNGDLVRQDFRSKNFPLPLTCCFSDKNDDILMWSHYAKHHKGVCLCFKSKLIDGVPHLTINSKPLKLEPIKYEKKAPNPINLRNQIQEIGQLYKFLTTKAENSVLR